MKPVGYYDTPKINLMKLLIKEGVIMSEIIKIRYNVLPPIWQCDCCGKKILKANSPVSFDNISIVLNCIGVILRFIELLQEYNKYWKNSGFRGEISERFIR